jgi:hypothetical protein
MRIKPNELQGKILFCQSNHPDTTLKTMPSASVGTKPCIIHIEKPDLMVWMPNQTATLPATSNGTTPKRICQTGT